jgi:hypothetical protein
MTSAHASIGLVLLFTIQSALACTVAADATPPGPGMHFDTLRCKWVNGRESPMPPIWDGRSEYLLKRAMPWIGTGPQRRFGPEANTFILKEGRLSDRLAAIQAAP